jgi:sigma-B regulation protein RsbU (phosphoserine phosphatase)
LDTKSTSGQYWFPIKYKLIIFNSLLIIFAFSIFAYFAQDLFRKDKSAYIYESALNHNHLVSIDVDRGISEYKMSLDALSALPFEKNLYRYTLLKTQDMFSLAYYQHNGTNWTRTHRLIKKNILKKFNIGLSYVNNLDEQILSQLEQSARGFIIFSKEKIPHYTIASRSNKNAITIARISLEGFIRKLEENKIFETIILDEALNAVLINNENINLETLKSQIPKTLRSGAFSFETANENYLASFTKLESNGLYVISLIPQRDAFLAIKILITKSYYFIAALICFAIIASIIFSKTMTKPLTKLFNLTQNISLGNFSERASIPNRDEIGALAQSFNFMSDKIVLYMNEMKEKAKMENELEVAKMVQNAFFPHNIIKPGNLEIYGDLIPASQCGGDWWGHLSWQGKSILIIADATGHGVPAALITATAHCCLSNLKELLTMKPSLIDSPNEILTFMNNAICDNGETILMTAFIAIIDESNNQVLYSNASHTPPLLFKNTSEEITKASFVPLMEANGPRLGEILNNQYTVAKIELFKKDAIIFYTDGLIDCANIEERKWGQRNFIKSLCETVQLDAKETVNETFNHLNVYKTIRANDDDITLLVVKKV